MCPVSMVAHFLTLLLAHSLIPGNRHSYIMQVSWNFKTNAMHLLEAGYDIRTIQLRACKGVRPHLSEHLSELRELNVISCRHQRFQGSTHENI